MEKTIFLRFMYLMTAISIILTIIELSQLTSRRLRRYLIRHRSKKREQMRNKMEDYMSHVNILCLVIVFSLLIQK